MPVRAATENRDEFRLVVLRFSDHIHPADVLACVTHALSNLAPDQSYRELLIFEHDADLSDLTSEVLATLYRECEELYHRLKLGPRVAAAMLDESIDAKMIMPLFNALALAGGSADLSFELFTDVEPALKWLHIPIEEGLKIIARAA